MGGGNKCWNLVKINIECIFNKTDDIEQYEKLIK